MLPIILGKTKVALIGAGDGLARRQTFLAASGLLPELLLPDTSAQDLSKFTILFLAGLSRSKSETVAAAARTAGVLVNVEDQPDLCDFHVPAVVRRGDLLISISTSGRSPGLTKLIRQWIEQALPTAWADWLQEASARRAGWRQSGVAAPEVAHRTSQLVEQRGWLP